MEAEKQSISFLQKRLGLAALPAVMLLGMMFGLVWAAPGDLDLSFGNGGVVLTNFDEGSMDHIQAVAIQPDGRIVAAGTKYVATSWSDFAAARYNRDGSPDTSFGDGGKVSTDFTGWVDEGRTLVVQPDGKVVVGGAAYDIQTGRIDFGLVRYENDGALDPTFGTGGIVTTKAGSGTQDDDSEAYGLALQPDGKLILAGWADNDLDDVNFAVVRYDSDGSLDPSFGVGGIVTTPVSNLYDMGQAVLLQPDGKILVAGYANNGYDNDLALARYTVSGAFDVEFGTGGVVTTDLGSDDYGVSVARQRDGKIVVAGYNGYWAEFDVILARYESDGDLDSSFGDSGFVFTDLDGGPELGSAVAIQPDGKILVVGEAWVPGMDDPDATWDIMLLRYTVDGELDNSFGSGGIVFSDMLHDHGTSVTVQRDGRIVVGGMSQITEADSYDFTVVRYHTRVTGTASVGAQPIPIGDTNVQAWFQMGGPCTVAVTKTIAFPPNCPELGKLPIYWEISTDCGSTYDMGIDFCYTGSELYNSASVTETELVIFKKAGIWVNQGGTVNVDTNCVTLDHITSLGYWALGRPVTFHYGYLPLVVRPTQ